MNVSLRHRCLNPIDSMAHVGEMNAKSRGSCVGSIADPDETQFETLSRCSGVPCRKPTLAADVRIPLVRLQASS
jgi:hypothetical protein